MEQNSNGVIVASNTVEKTGGNVNYYLVEVKNPKRLAPYTAEAEDIINALGMSFDEGTILKSLWRKCAARQGRRKAGGDEHGVYDAEKIVYYAKEGLRHAQYARDQANKTEPSPEVPIVAQERGQTSCIVHVEESPFQAAIETLTAMVSQPVSEPLPEPTFIVEDSGLSDSSQQLDFGDQVPEQDAPAEQVTLVSDPIEVFCIGSGNEGQVLAAYHPKQFYTPVFRDVYKELFVNEQAGAVKAGVTINLRTICLSDQDIVEQSLQNKMIETVTIEAIVVSDPNNHDCLTTVTLPHPYVVMLPLRTTMPLVRLHSCVTKEGVATVYLDIGLVCYIRDKLNFMLSLSEILQPFDGGVSTRKTLEPKVVGYFPKVTLTDSPFH